MMRLQKAPANTQITPVAAQSPRWGWAHLWLAALGVLQALSLSWPAGIFWSVAAAAANDNAASGLSLRPGQTLWWLQLLTMLGFYFLLQKQFQRPTTTRQTAWLAYAFSLPWMIGSIWWLYISMNTYGGLASWLSAFAVWLLASILALFYVIAIALWHRYFYTESKPVWNALCFAAWWLLAELARGKWFTGLPWGATGYAQVDGPFAAYAPYVGVYGVGGVIALVAALLICRNKAAGAMAASLFLLCWVLPQNWTQASPSMSVNLLQGNIPQDEKFVPGTGVRTALEWYREQLLLSQAELTVTPEIALPSMVERLPTGYWQSLQAHYETSRKLAIVGVVGAVQTEGPQQAYTNSAQTLGGGDGHNGRYDKHHLVPFGELIPPFAKWFVDLMNIPLGSFAAGGLAQPSIDYLGNRIAVNICYEDLFGEELAAAFREAQKAPTVLVNMSNIAWFGHSTALPQHLNISRMRSLELQRPMLRSTNTGATAIVDYQGQVQQQLPYLQRSVLNGQVAGRTGLTPYAYWASRYGQWPLWLLCLLVLTFSYRRQSLLRSGL